MKKRVRKKIMKKWIKSTVDSVHMDMEVIHRNTGINMCYQFIKNYLLFDSDRLPIARREMYNMVDLEVYIKTLTLHELGHSLDRDALLASLPKALEFFRMKRKSPIKDRKLNLELFKLDIDEHEMNYVFEETAWENAEKLNRLYNIVDWVDFEKVKFNSLLTYTACYNRDLLIYQRLAAEADKQIAV
ncbi:hypothetical protein [Lederbergia lenta]|uniref:Integrase n=1 Tax=Lederbergia lenta TaxID=1467 RepID=A0A2X4W7S0_LEDLE|nr:hypothetical protein [Lederbergia lenta]MCM3110770.1 integrase [Lederbergia lenta]MEC2325835.1 integrase [Lederbergia lenta]SQI53680.1 Uncharacterised protein [Lederbergia lenta]